MKRLIGIDEAGRGPVIGSMFIGGVVIDEERLDELEGIGLKDSKKLDDAERERLGDEVEAIADAFLVREVTATEIDELRAIMSLNKVEIRAFADIIDELEPDRAYIDLPEPDGERFGDKIRNELGRDDLDVVAEHGADDTYPIVSAASILAKNAREDHVAALQDKYGRDFGSGYPHDTPTTDFLEDHVAEHGELP
ncbi:MAG: ribonuclease HII, partial [Candidatus Nanohaloarchaea archaeon]|nr:ribonuclease HII [Candidatus Nanohaloarchaea archaeon]